jgi:hypothetical protein
MTQQEELTKADIVSRLREGGEDALRRLRALDSASFDEGRYENGWNGRQILAHLASIEWTYPRIIDLARDKAAGTPPPPPQPKPAAPSSPGTPQIMGYNDRQVEKRAGATVEELLEEFETNRATTIKAVEAADDALFSVVVTSAGGARGPMANVLNYVAVLHVAQHVNDIAG